MRFFILSFALTLPVHAHDFWLEAHPQGLVLSLGHRNGDLTPIDSAALVSVRCLSPAAKSLKELRRAVGPTIVVSESCAHATAAYDHGLFSLTPRGELKGDAPDAVRQWRSRQFATWCGEGVSCQTPTGAELEVSAVDDLRGARVGKKLVFRVLSESAPVDGAVVALGHKVLGETDSEGVIRLRLREPGPVTISATWRRPQLVLEASLTFVVPP